MCEVSVVAAASFAVVLGLEAARLAGLERLAAVLPQRTKFPKVGPELRSFNLKQV